MTQQRKTYSREPAHTERVVVMVTPEERAQLARVATEQGMFMSEVLRAGLALAVDLACEGGSLKMVFTDK